MSTAKCASLLKQEFPSIDDEMKQYIEGVLESGMDDFESSSDLYDAIGAILHEVAIQKSENDIRLIEMIDDNWIFFNFSWYLFVFSYI